MFACDNFIFPKPETGNEPITPPLRLEKHEENEIVDIIELTIIIEGPCEWDGM